MRIVHLGKYYPPAPGGIETVTQTLARGQAAAGHTVRVLAIQHATDDERDAMFEPFTPTRTRREWDEGVRVVRLGRHASLARLDLAAELLDAIRAERSEPPNVWHVHAPNPTMMLALAALPGLGPLIIQHHSDVIRQRVLKHLFRPLERLVYRRAACVLATSAAYADASPLLRAFRDKVRILPLGIDTERFVNPSPAALVHAARLRQNYGEPLWLSVGRLIPYKGLTHGLHALRGVPGTWLVVGTGPLAQPLRKQAEALGVADRVVWLGHTQAEELVGAYHAATALWFPSVARNEGFGLVQAEAMAAGCPVINTEIAGSGVPWVCLHGETGLTVPVHDPVALAHAARQLWDDPDLRRRLGEAARRRAVAEFDHVCMVERCLEVYCSLGTGRTP